MLLGGCDGSPSPTEPVDDPPLAEAPASPLACHGVKGELLGYTDLVNPVVGYATGDLEGDWIAMAAPSPLPSGAFNTGIAYHMASWSQLSITGGTVEALVGEAVILEGDRDIQVATAVERVNGHWRVGGAAEGHLTGHGTARFIMLPGPTPVVEFAFRYNGSICP